MVASPNQFLVIFQVDLAPSPEVCISPILVVLNALDIGVLSGGKLCNAGAPQPLAEQGVHQDLGPAAASAARGASDDDALARD